ncbi:MAG TPA: DUF434 domain-containing protein [Bacteroidales bacterium]|nr:DUF434 domain-containing protein [Bacteroidales bacterium]
MPDKSLNSSLLTDTFRQACTDYFYLVNHHYPERSVLKLVGDRYLLSGDQRTVLYRGISSEKRSLLRNSLLQAKIAGTYLIIDGYNVLFNLLNYRLGKITFVSTDGIVRDAGALHGRFREEHTFTDCIELLLIQVAAMKPATVDIYLDSPVSHSERHATAISDRMHELNLTGGCYVVKSADWVLKNCKDCVIATSDTAIIEKALLPVVDLPAVVLERAYGAGFLQLGKLISGGTSLR